MVRVVKLFEKCDICGANMVEFNCEGMVKNATLCSSSMCKDSEKMYFLNEEHVCPGKPFPPEADWNKDFPISKNDF